MTKDRALEASGNGLVANRILSKRQSRRKFLKAAGSALAAGAFGAVPLRGWAADPCLLYTSPSPRDGLLSRMPSSA